MGSIFKDKEFFSTMFRLAYPIMLQNLIFSSLGIVDGLMIGQLGESAVASVGVANQIYFLAMLLFFGITSGTAIFTAQYWGKEDIPRIQSVLGLSLLMSVFGALVFSLVAILNPAKLMGIYTTDMAVINQGSKYLQIVAFSYVLTAVTNSYSTALRSTENVKLPMLVSLLALSLNTILNYGLILGNFGLPALGVVGAAIATVSSRLLETMFLLVLVYRRKLPVAAKLSNLLNYKVLSFRQFFKTTFPVVATDIVWSFGITTYNVVYARIGTESIAAINIAGTLDRLIFVVFIGLGNACAIMIGNRIGAGEHDIASTYGKKILIFGAIGAVIFGLLMLTAINPLLSLYKVSADTIAYTNKILIIMACFLPIRALNMIMLIGILRSGGDTRYAFFIDAGVIWSIGVPLAIIGAFVLNLPIHWVYLLIMTEEVVKLSLGLYRFFSKRWIHSLAVPA